MADQVTKEFDYLEIEGLGTFKPSGSGGTIYIPKALYDHLGDGTSSGPTIKRRQTGQPTTVTAQLHGRRLKVLNMNITTPMERPSSNGG